MPINRIGTTTRIFATLFVDNVPTDPNTLTLIITDPAASDTFYEFGIDPEIVQDSVGVFHFDLQLTQRGIWEFAWTSNSSLVAFESGQIVVAQQAIINTVDDEAPTPNVVPFATLKIFDSDANLVETDVDPQKTDASGQFDTELPEGQFRITAFKIGWIFEPILTDLVGVGPYNITVPGRLLMSNWLKWEDLECVVDKATVDRLFTDDNDNTRDMILVEAVIQQAEALAEAQLLRSWTREQIFKLGREDKAMRAMAAWFAIEMASERKQEFIAADGKGRFWAQYERSQTYFVALSKSQYHSRGEIEAGQGSNSGGNRLPKLRSNQDPFVYAPGINGREPGGF